MAAAGRSAPLALPQLRNTQTPQHANIVQPKISVIWRPRDGRTKAYGEAALAAASSHVQCTAIKLLTSAASFSPNGHARALAALAHTDRLLPPTEGRRTMRGGGGATPMLRYVYHAGGMARRSCSGAPSSVPIAS